MSQSSYSSQSNNEQYNQFKSSYDQPKYNMKYSDNNPSSYSNYNHIDSNNINSSQNINTSSSNKNKSQSNINKSQININKSQSLFGQLPLIVNENNVYKVLNVFKKYKYINPIILSDITTNKLQLSTLSKQELLIKNQPYLNTGTAPLIFANLVDILYYKALPQSFQQKYSQYTGKYNMIYNFYFIGVVSWAFIARRLSKRSLWYKLTKSNNFLMKNVFMIWGSLILINQFYLQGMSRLCKNNIQVVDAVFDTHLQLIASHGVDINKAIQYYTNSQLNRSDTNNQLQIKINNNTSNTNNLNKINQNNQQQTQQLLVNNNKVSGQSQQQLSMSQQTINQYNISKYAHLPIPKQLLFDDTNSRNNIVNGSQQYKKSDYAY